MKLRSPLPAYLYFVEMIPKEVFASTRRGRTLDICDDLRRRRSVVAALLPPTPSTQLHLRQDDAPAEVDSLAGRFEKACFTWGLCGDTHQKREQGSIPEMLKYGEPWEPNPDSYIPSSENHYRETEEPEIRKRMPRKHWSRLEGGGPEQASICVSGSPPHGKADANECITSLHKRRPSFKKESPSDGHSWCRQRSRTRSLPRGPRLFFQPKDDGLLNDIFIKNDEDTGVECEIQTVGKKRPSKGVQRQHRARGSTETRTLPRSRSRPHSRSRSRSGRTRSRSRSGRTGMRSLAINSEGRDDGISRQPERLGLSVEGRDPCPQGSSGRLCNHVQKKEGKRELRNLLREVEALQALIYPGEPVNECGYHEFAKQGEKLLECLTSQRGCDERVPSSIYLTETSPHHKAVTQEVGMSSPPAQTPPSQMEWPTAALSSCHKRSIPRSVSRKLGRRAQTYNNGPASDTLENSDVYPEVEFVTKREGKLLSAKGSKHSGVQRKQQTRGRTQTCRSRSGRTGERSLTRKNEQRDDGITHRGNLISPVRHRSRSRSRSRHQSKRQAALPSTYRAKAKKSPRHASERKTLENAP